MIARLSFVNRLSVFVLQNFFYSRKNFMKPAHQDFPHRNFEEEVEFLSQIFPSTSAHTHALSDLTNQGSRVNICTHAVFVFSSDGAAYCMGRLNSDCW